MEKRRLLLVVMLLATSGAALAMDGVEEGGTGEGDQTPRGNVFKRGAHKGAKRTRGFFVKIGNAFSVRWHRSRTAIGEGNYGTAALEAAAAPGNAFLDMSLSDFMPCLQASPSKWVALGHTGVTIGLGVALYKTVKSEKVQDRAKKLMQGIRRTLSFRKKTPEKKTDASVIEA